ncbi:MAG: hypothetical protein QF415_03030 [Candidatus Undinarchaeales archaeon]|nr:hypothetical protein [Candidatus Undinarchaeales archaeon]MDP7492798.1 hypothetical protein [Candidatus Undinarchaeales archaeon]
MVLDETTLRARAHAYFVACAMTSQNEGLCTSTFDALLRSFLQSEERDELLRAAIVTINIYVDTGSEHDLLTTNLPPRELLHDHLQDALESHERDMLDDEDWDNLLLFLEAKLFHANILVSPALQSHSNLDLMQVDPLMFELEHLF